MQIVFQGDNLHGKSNPYFLLLEKITKKIINLSSAEFAIKELITTAADKIWIFFFVCVEVLQPSQPSGVS